MKRVWVLFFLTIWHVKIAANETEGSPSSSVGARTEALFIINNKIKDVREYVQVLKKQLTESHTAKQPRYKHWMQRKLARYHREFRDIVFTASIRELECLSDYIEKAAEKLAIEGPVEETELRRVVEQALLIKKKIDLESHILELLTTIDTQEMQRAYDLSRSSSRKRVHSSRFNSQPKPSLESIKKAKRSLHNVQKLVAQTNERLYEELGCSGERTFIDKLTLYKP